VGNLYPSHHLGGYERFHARVEAALADAVRVA
jgi:hypothetical protein